jgi:phosphatidylglycerol---prolipoprotein diacylglyceryl transferase
MYPVLLRLGSFEVTSFGVMVALGAALGILLLRREMIRAGLDPAKGMDAALVGVLGGLAGAKLLYVAEHWAEPLSQTLLSRGGMSWYGGFTGGVLAGVAIVAWQNLPLMGVLAAASPAMTLGHAVGRIGCFLVGDDYGRPTSLPWGIAFPEGLPPTADKVHPTQLYEAAALFAMTAVLVALRKRGLGDRKVFATYLLGAGIIRFAIELVRVNVVVFAGMTTAQLFSVALVVAGAVLLAGRGAAPAAPVPVGPRARPAHRKRR